MDESTTLKVILYLSILDVGLMIMFLIPVFTSAG